MNVALNKSGKYCDIHEMSKLIFDGDTNYQNSDKFHSMCFNSMHTFLIIDLVEMYSVQHVVVYHGTGKRYRLLCKIADHSIDWWVLRKHS